MRINIKEADKSSPKTEIGEKNMNKLIISKPLIETTYKDEIVDNRRELYVIMNFKFMITYKHCDVEVRIELIYGYGCINCTTHNNTATLYVDNIVVDKVLLDDNVTIKKLNDTLNNVKISACKRRQFMTNRILNEIDITKHLGNLFIYGVIGIPVKYTGTSELSVNWILFFTIDEDSCASLVPASMINYISKSLEKNNNPLPI